MQSVKLFSIISLSGEDTTLGAGHPGVTEDDSCSDVEYQHSSRSPASRQEEPQRVELAIGTAKFMLTVIWASVASIC
jgi:hypothetical protein